MISAATKIENCLLQHVLEMCIVQHDAEGSKREKLTGLSAFYGFFVYGIFSLNIDPNIIPIIVCASMSNVCGFYGINHLWTKIAQIKTPSPIWRPIVAGK